MAQTEQQTDKISSGCSSDPLQASIPLPLHHVLFPFGFPMRIKTNEPAVMRAAEESWGPFPQSYRDIPIEVRVVVSDAPSRRRPPIPCFRAQANLLTFVADQHNFGSCDLAAGFGFAHVTKAATTHKDYIRYYFLEAMVHTLLDTRHMMAIHAACVEFEGHGVLFVGESGAGKSSMAYAAARRGWAYLCDDATSFILHKTGRTVVGNPYAIRLRPSALPLFPEINGRLKSRNGKPKIEIETERLRHVRVVSQSSADYVIFLNRSSTPVNAAVKPISRPNVLRRLSKSPWPEELVVNEERSAALERLLSARALELTYRDFDPALDLLEAVIRGTNL